MSAYTGELYPEVIRLGELYRDVAANKNEVYQFLAKSHMAMQDTVGAMPFLEEGIRLYPETTFYFGSMICGRTPRPVKSGLVSTCEISPSAGRCS